MYIYSLLVILHNGWTMHFIQNAQKSNKNNLLFCGFCLLKFVFLCDKIISR